MRLFLSASTHDFIMSVQYVQLLDKGQRTTGRHVTRHKKIVLLHNHLTRVEFQLRPESGSSHALALDSVTLDMLTPHSNEELTEYYAEPS